jgi:hypothetical protein
MKLFCTKLEGKYRSGSVYPLILNLGSRLSEHAALRSCHLSPSSVKVDKFFLSLSGIQKCFLDYPKRNILLYIKVTADRMDSHKTDCWQSCTVSENFLKSLLSRSKTVRSGLILSLEIGNLPEVHIKKEGLKY